MVGGAPITAEFAASIGADGFAEDASRAVSVAKSLIVV
jgi:methanogenic corrinoid protein MtbC1